MDIKKIINEEIHDLAYSIPELAKLMGRQGFDAEGQGHLQDVLMDAYRENGDQGVVDTYAKMAGVEIQALTRGRYVFHTLTGGGEDMLEEIESNCDHRPNEMPS